MANKKGKGKGKKKGSSRSKSIGGLDLQETLGLAIGIYGGVKIEDLIPQLANMDPNIKAVGKIAVGQFGKNMPMVRNFIKDDSLRKGIGSGLASEGIRELLQGMGLIQGIGAPLDDDDELAVVIEGIDDIDSVNADVLGEDIPSVNADVLGEDEEDEDYGEHDLM